MQIIITDGLIVIFLADFYFLFIYLFSKWGATDLFI